MKINKEDWKAMIANVAKRNDRICEQINPLSNTNAAEYTLRHKYKENPKQDIEKAIWYLQRYLKALSE